MGGKGKGKGKGGKGGKNWKKRKNDKPDYGSDDDGEKKKQARRDEWAEDTGDIEMKNEQYEAYYRRQNICSAEDFPKVLEAFRTGLPSALRVNRTRPGARAVCGRLEDMRVSCGGAAERECYAPQQLSWYPHALAWQWHGLERRTIKKDQRHGNLKNWLAKREGVGLISRQEAVSMIPPLFLDVEPHHLVLDLCAAPGSKTSQLLEIIHWRHAAEGGPPPTGLVCANEIQWKRANLLAHQVSRLGSPCAAVVNMDAQYFPVLTETDAEANFRFDRVLCDVPCSGDGTMRKTPYIWRSWTKRDGLGLHIRQYTILTRGLELLQVGGKLVYSTCSLNPMEDESVVLAVLRKHGAALRLLPPPPLEGLRSADGLAEWLVPNPEDSSDEMFRNYADVPTELRSCKCKLLPSMFPPSPEELKAGVGDALSTCCRRFLPHLMNTGGFFVVTFEKVSEFEVGKRRAAQREASASTTEAVAAQDMPTNAPEDAPEDALEEDTLEMGTDQDAAVDEATTTPPGAAAGNGEKVPQARGKKTGTQMQPISREYAFVAGTPAWEEIAAFYGLEPSLGHRIVVKSDNDRRMYLLSEGAARLVRTKVKHSTRMVLVGVVAFEDGSAHVRACQWLLAQDGLNAVVALGLRRRVVASRAFLTRLLSENVLQLSEVRSAVAAGSVRALEGPLLEGDGGSLKVGSVALVLDAAGEEGVPPFVVVGTISDDALEVSVTGKEAKALLEDLQGQPSVDEILGQAEEAPAEKAAEEAADAAAEAGPGPVA